MTVADVPWLELGLVACVSGLLLSLTSRHAGAWTVAACAAALVFATLEWLCHQAGWTQAPGPRWVGWLAVDRLGAPMLPLVALLHLLSVLTKPKAESDAGHLPGALLSLSIQLATFGCTVPWVLVSLLVAGTLPPWVGLLTRGRPSRLFGLHMATHALLLVAGMTLVSAGQTMVGCALILCATAIRCGLFPLHVWVPGLFAEARLGAALVFVAPLTGVYAIARLVLPVPEVPAWMLDVLAGLALGTALYAAGLALVQREARRLFAYLFLSHASLVVVGLGLRSSVSLTGALSLWVAVALSLGGLGLVLRAVEARFGQLVLTRYLGLYAESPALAGCFLLLGLASVGFPGTLGFVGTELLVDGAVREHILIGLGVVLTAMLNGIAVMRAYFLIFTGGRHEPAVPLGITVPEQIAVMTLSVLVMSGGLYPQPGIASRQKVSSELLSARNDADRTQGADSRNSPTHSSPRR